MNSNVVGDTPCCRGRCDCTRVAARRACTPVRGRRRRAVSESEVERACKRRARDSHRPARPLRVVRHTRTGAAARDLRNKN